jgi:hypothetical protein
MKHFAKYNYSIAAKNYAKKSQELSEDQYHEFKKQKTAASVKRTHKSEKERQYQLDLIEDPEIRRIAQILDRIKKKEAYVIVPDVIHPSTTIKDIKTTGPEHFITFGSATLPYKRTMQAIENPMDILSNVLAAMRHVFSKCNHLVVKLLKSKAGDAAQDIHTDFIPTTTTPSIKDLSAFHYSAIISFEENTRLLCHVEEKEVNIPLYSMLFFRGDFIHAGAAYAKMNRRIFISISSTSFPVTDDVFLHTFV